MATSLPIHHAPSTDPKEPDPNPAPTRRLYTGSCHCGLTKYQTHLALPPSPPGKSDSIRVRKCNCTTCHKMSFFHVRVPDAHQDFRLLSPIISSSPSSSPSSTATGSPSPAASKPEAKGEDTATADNKETATEETKRESAHGGIKLGASGLRDYACFLERIHWYFCSRCGVRCFAFSGEGEIRTVEIDDGETNKTKTKTKREVWMPKKGFWEGDMGRGSGYLSVNAATLDAGQEGLDLRAWHEEGRIVYLDVLEEKGMPRLGRPFVGGMY